MIRVLIFIAAVFLLALGAAWIADQPGNVSVAWEGYRYDGSLGKTVLLLAIVVLAIMVIWGLIRSLLRSPKLAARFFRRRRRDRGYDALSKGLIALGVGDAVAARRFGNEAAKLLDGAPAARLLLAQAAQLSGDREEARQRFDAMLADPQLKAVALHGLFIEAERVGQPVAARHYAEEAGRLVPGLPWAGRATLGYQAVAGDWEAAIRTLEANYASKLVDKKTFRRHKAVLMTARALEIEDRDPDRARSLALEAHGLAPDLVPAAVVAARLSTRRGDLRKAMKVLETAWKLSPHPDLADAYAHARPGDSALDRLKRVKALAALRAHHGEGALAVAAAAIEARDFALARAELTGVLRSAPSRRACLLMADLEEAEHGDRGRVREWLARAVRAPADPTWVADGVAAAEWAPVSPTSGKIDAFEWKVPPTMLPPAEPEAIDDALFEAPPTAMTQDLLPPAAEAEAVEPAVVVPAGPEMRPATTSGPAADPNQPRSGEPVKAEPAGEAKTPATAPEGTSEDDSRGDGIKPDKAVDATSRSAPAAVEEVEVVDAKSAGAEEASSDSPAPDVAPTKPDGSSQAKHGPKPEPREIERAKPIEFPLKHMPDDPGPEGDDTEAPPQPGYRFFN